MNPVFADTFYWIALTGIRDEAHRSALAISRALASRRIVNSESVLTEYLNYHANDAAMRVVAARSVRDILSGQAVTVIPQETRLFLLGLDLYESRADKGYSLTDCISMCSMRALGIADVLTNDRHFAQEGFRPMFRV